MSSNTDTTTPVRVPKAATSSYTPGTQDPDLRSQINSVLLGSGHITRIHETLTTSLSTHPADWSAKVREHTLALLRSGEYTTFPALMARVTADIKAATDAQRAEEEHKANGTSNGTSNGTAQASSSANIAHLAVPRSVIEEGVTVARECLEQVKDSKLDELDGTVWENVERNGIKIKLRKLDGKPDDKPDGKLDGKLDGNVEGDVEGKRMKPKYKLDKKRAEEKSSSPWDTP